MLHIWLPSQHSPLRVWQPNTNSWVLADNWQSVVDNNSQSKGTQACLYFPSSHILQIQNKLSSSQLKQLGETGKQYLFEEMSLTPVESLTVKQLNQNAHTYLYATAKSDIEKWQNSASLAGVEIAALLPDFLLLPSPEKSSSDVFVYHDDYTTLLRQSEASGTTVGYFPLFFNQLDLVDELLIVESIFASESKLGDNPTDDSNEESESKDNMNNANELIHFLNSSNILHASTGKQLNIVEQPTRHPLNYVIKKQTSRISPYFKTAMLVGFFALMAQIFADFYSGMQYENAVAKVESGLQTQYKAWFPNERLNNRTDIQLQLQPFLQSGGDTGNNMVEVFERVSPVIKQSNLTAQNLMIDGSAINLKLVARNRGELDSFISRLQEQGISAQLGNIQNLTQTPTTDVTAGGSNPSAQSKVVGDINIISETSVEGTSSSNDSDNLRNPEGLPIVERPVG